ncbi:MAG TPA: SRPBCC family protein [Ktedonosporobacter sp.]|nr:SRPBCC family protein [Ktedonosporobacter sp.]
MAEHHVSVTVKAPVHQVYTLFTHFNDFPKFMHFVKEVTSYDEQRTHWVVHVLRKYEWDAVKEDWIPDRQVGWRSISGLKNTGKVKFLSLAPDRTVVDVYISYTPPTGPLGMLGETLGGNEYFDFVLREDLQHFARMVEQAPSDALDPMSSHYLFHESSAVAAGTVTDRQRKSMAHDPRMSPQALAERQARLQREEEQKQQVRSEREATEKRRAELAQKALLEQKTLLERELARRSQEQRERDAALANDSLPPREHHPVYDTIGGRNASRDRTALGDRDGTRHRHPGYEQDPMQARYPLKGRQTIKLSEEELNKSESPWLHSIRGTELLPLPPPQEPPSSKS